MDSCQTAQRPDNDSSPATCAMVASITSKHARERKAPVPNRITKESRPQPTPTRLALSDSSSGHPKKTTGLCTSEVDADLLLIGLEEMRIAQREQAQEGHVLEEHDVDGAPDRINTGLLMERDGDAPQRCTAE